MRRTAGELSGEKKSPDRSFDSSLAKKVLGNADLNQKISLSMSRRSDSKSARSEKGGVRRLPEDTRVSWRKFGGPFSFDLVQDAINSIRRYKLKLSEQKSIRKTKEDSYENLVIKSTETNKGHHEQLKYMTSNLDYYRNARILDPRYRNIFRPPPTLKFVATKLDDDPYGETSKDKLTKLCEIRAEFQDAEDKVSYIQSKLVELYKHLIWDHRAWM